ncbi:MAG: methionine--tRNA ligase [Candidatus Tectomicrobia bacterium RIFCSPLOWO2_02_FULL_70_19]|nr:MAG: methionine--tRNA ligase [Candidatus Tectomicrobia bacterium RIFCSPLOWO2_02_FULL_70_19]
MTKPFYVTTPIYYVNDKPHLGHAYTTIAADAKVRFHRLRGEPAFLLTGTDENAQKVERAARAAGADPRAFCDAYSAKFRGLWAKLGIRFDDYIRTTEERHVRGVQEIWRRVARNGDIYLGSYAGWYAVRDEAFYTEEELTEGPGGKKIAPSGAEAEWVEEPSYFFRLGKYQERLLAHYRGHPEFIQPETRRNEVVRFVEGGLRDLSVSRTSIKWGIPVPDDPAHVVYVWFDALSNYLTAGGFGPAGAAPANPWPADQHFIGKDIIRFHAVFWPAFLMSAGVELPRQVFGHGWWTVEGQKMSKSLGNAVDPHWLIEEYGADAIRYFLLREIPFGADGDFSHRALIDRINSDLANDLGNLLHRTLSMVKRFREGRVRRARGGEGEAESNLNYLAREAHVGGGGAPQAGVRPRLVDGRGPEDVQEPRERGGPPLAHRGVRGGRHPLLPPARDPLRGGRGLLPPRPDRPDQQRPRQRPGEPPPPHPEHGEALPGGEGEARAGRGGRGRVQPELSGPRGG